MSLLLRFQGPPPAFAPDDEPWVRHEPQRAAPFVRAFAAEDDIVPQPAAFAPDEVYWHSSQRELAQRAPWVASADDEITPKLDEEYWLQLQRRGRAPYTGRFDADDELVPQPVGFVPDEEYGPRYVFIEEPRFAQAWVSDGASSGAVAPTFTPDEEYWQRVLLLDDPRWAQAWVSDGAASAPAPSAFTPDEDYWSNWQHGLPPYAKSGRLFGRWWNGDGDDAPTLSAERPDGAKLFKAARRQRYLYRCRRVEEKVSKPVAEAICNVVERFDDEVRPKLGEAAALLAAELRERGLKASPRYTKILRDEIDRLARERDDDDDDAINAVLTELLR